MSVPRYHLYYHSDAPERACIVSKYETSGSIEDEFELTVKDSLPALVGQENIDDDLFDHENGIFPDASAIWPPDNLEPESESSENDDNLEAFGIDVITNLRYRARVLQDKYPFDFYSNSISLKENLSDINYLYIYLLGCSQTSIFDDNLAGALRKSFEELSFFCLRSLFSDWIFVERFMANTASGTSFYSGLFEQKVRLLGKELGYKIFDTPSFNPTNLGDGGLDIVAYPKFIETPGSIPVVFAQCACSAADWPLKRFEVQYSNWEGVIKMDLSPLPLIFIPFCFRTPDGKWFEPKDVTGTSVIDRHRILEIYERVNDANLTRTIKQLVERIFEAYHQKYSIP